MYLIMHDHDDNGMFDLFDMVIEFLENILIDNNNLLSCFSLVCSVVDYSTRMYINKESFSCVKLVFI